MKSKQAAGSEKRVRGNLSNSRHIYGYKKGPKRTRLQYSSIMNIYLPVTLRTHGNQQRCLYEAGHFKDKILAESLVSVCSLWCTCPSSLSTSMALPTLPAASPEPARVQPPALPAAGEQRTDPWRVGVSPSPNRKREDRPANGGSSFGQKTFSLDQRASGSKHIPAPGKSAAGARCARTPTPLL